MGNGCCDRRVILSPTPRERERWHLVAGPRMDRLIGVAERWNGTRTPSEDVWPPPSVRVGQRALIFGSGGCPSQLGRNRPGAERGCISTVGLGLARTEGGPPGLWRRFGISLNRSSCLNYLHRLGFAFKRPKKRLLKGTKPNEGLRGGVRRPRPRGKAVWRQDILWRPTSGPTRRLRGKLLRGEPLWWIQQAAVCGRRPATTRRCDWRRGRWSGWNWRAQQQ